MSSEPTESATAADPRLDRVVDDADRVVAFERYRPERYGGLAAMYDDFPPEQRAQGLPPTTESGITEWLGALLDHVSVLAVHDDAVVGHAALVPDDANHEDATRDDLTRDDATCDDATCNDASTAPDAGTHELGVFVACDYQDAGVGTALLEATFEYARTIGVTDVWLSVARSNHRARHVYDALGFAEAGGKGRSLRLTMSL